MKDQKPKYIVNNDEEHAMLLKKVDALMRKGEEHTTPEEDAEILAMAEAIMAYERPTYEIHDPKTLEGILELRMYEMRLEGKDLAQTLGISQEELEMILWEERKPEAALLEVIKEKLDIPVELTMNHA